MTRRFWYLAVGLLTMGLTGCASIAVGPDLAKSPSPFGDSQDMRLSKLEELRTYLKIVHTAEGDKGIYRDADQGNFTYSADVTYYGFEPLLAETNAERRTYWLVGVNLTQTKDRSYYFLLRYPYGKPLRAGETRTDFELAIVGCNAMQDGISRALYIGGHRPTSPAAEEEYDWSKGTFPARAPDPIPEPPAPIVLPDDPSDKGCEFRDMDELKQFAPKALQADEKHRRENLTKKAEDDRSTNIEWVSVQAEAK